MTVRMIVVFAFLCALTVFTGTAQANSGGVTGRSTAGCAAVGCHGYNGSNQFVGPYRYSGTMYGNNSGSWSSGTQTLDDYGDSFSLLFFLNKDSGSNAQRFGLNVSTSGGTLNETAASLNKTNDEIHHTTPFSTYCVPSGPAGCSTGSGDRQFGSMSWTPPAFTSGDFTVSVCGNVVDNDGAADAGDNDSGGGLCDTLYIAVRPYVAFWSGTLTYTEGDGYVTVDSSYTQYASNLRQAVVTLTNPQTGDDLACPSSGTTGISCSDGGDVITFTPSAGTTYSEASFEVAVQGVRFANTSQNPNTATTRSVTLVVRDEDYNYSLSDTRYISVDAVNDSPSISNVNSVVNFSEGDSATIIDSSITLSDVDNTTLNRAEVQIYSNYQAEDVLACSNCGAYGLSSSFSAGQLTITGSASLATYDAALQSVTYANNSQSPSTLTRFVRFRIRDTSGDTGSYYSSYDATTINVASVNDVPTLSGLDTVLAYVEGQGARVIDSTLTVADVDSINLNLAEVYLYSNYESGEDFLACPSCAGNGLSASFSAGILSISGTASVATYETVLESVTYTNSSQAPSESTRSIAYRVRDTNDAYGSYDLSTITVAAENDAPTISGVTTALNYQEDSGAQTIDSSITVGDIDSTQLNRAEVVISVGLQAEDSLACPSCAGAGLSSSYSAGQLTITGTALLATYEAALESVSYTNSSDTPSTATRTVAFRVRDSGNIYSGYDTTTIGVTASNDDPTISGVDNILNYIEGNGAVIIDGAIAVEDVDSGLLNRAEVSISVNFESTEDTLAVSNCSGLSCSYNSASGLLTISGSASTATYETVLESITYANSSQNPSTSSRTVSYRVRDSANAYSAYDTTSINVAREDDSPVITQGVSVNVNMSEDSSPTPFVRTLNATDIDTAAGALTWSINTPALHGTASASGSGFSKAIGYTPDVDYTGADSFVVQVSDGTTFDVITVNVNIAGENDAPVIAEGASIGVVMSEDNSPTAFSLTLNATDAEGSALTWSINSNAGNGFAAASGTGASKVISYTPFSNFNGMDSFVVQVSDGVLSDTITVNVTINPENDSPVITEGASANVVMSEDATPTDFALTLNATDIDSGTLTWSISSTAANGTASASGSGASKTIGYVPNADFNGMDSFVVQVSDGSATDTLTVSVTVSSEDDAPTIDEGASVNVAMSEDGAPTPFSLLLNATDVDTAAGGLTWSIQTQANNGSASASGTGASKAISYVADAHYVGMDSFVVQVSDGAGAATIVVDVTLAAVNDAPIFSSTPPTSATETELYTYNVGVTDPDDSGLNSNIFITLNTAPAGMVLDPNSGVITWTPPVAGATPVDVEIQVEDGNEDSSAPQLQNWQISVDDVNDPPLITSTAPTTATEDTVYTYAVAVTDPDDANNGANLTWQLTNAPSGMTVSSTGVITWTPLEGVLTSGAVTVQVADGGESGASPDTENFTVSVTPVNDEPVITAVPSANAVESTLYSFTVTVSDPDDSNWNFSLSNAPAGMTIGATTGVINWTPAEGVSTSGTVTVSAADDGADGAMPGSQAFSIGVTAVNDAPQITSTALTSATEGVLYQYQLAVLDSDDANNGTDLSFVLNSAPAGMSVSSTGLIQWTPANGVASANVQVQVADGGENSAAPAVQSFTISVTAVNNPVQIDSAPVTTATEATLYSYQLAVTDLDDANNGTDLNFALLTAPAGMTVSSTGLIEWTPPEGTVSENVDVQVADGLEDGAVAASQAFSIAVTAVNNAPQITSTAPATGTEDIQYSYQLLVNDPDDANDGIALTYSLTNAPTGMAISPSGLITWTPTEGVSSSGSVTVDVQDGGEDGALPDSEIFSVAVTAVNDAPVITAVPTLSAVEDTLYNFSVTVSDDDDSSWTFALVNAPTGMSIDDNGLISWTPLNGVLTSGSVTVTAADGGEDGVAAAVQNFTIGVIPVNDAPTITAVPTINAVEDTLYAFNVLVSDPDDSSWSFSLNNQPAGMTIDANGLISWTADEGVSSSGTVTVNVADGGEDGATPDSQTFAIGVTPVNDAPVITALPSANATEDVAYTFTVTVSDPDDTSWTFSLSGAPIGMSIDANGEISWTPVEGDTTSGSVTVMVADGGEDSAAPDSQAFTIGVTAVNDAPQISSAAPLSVSEDVLYQYPLTVIDPDDSNNGELTFTLITAPVGMTISSTGLIQWTATEQGPLQLLPYDVDVEVEVRDGEEDGAAPDTQAFTLSVSPVNDAPLLTQVGAQTVEEQSAFDLTLVATDSDDNNNGTDLIWSLQSAPAAMSISTDGVMSWTPGQGTAGDYTITVVVADGEEDGAQPAQMTFVLTVTQLDGDGDGVADYDDNCPLESNADQANNDSDSDGDLCDPDDDNDGMTDVAELANGLDPFDSSDATADADNDGVTNLDEFLLCQGVGDVVCNAISQDSIAPLISHTPVRVNSNGFLTPVLLEANAVDTNDGNVAVEVVTINGKLLGPNNKVEAGQEYAFRTGRNEVIWRAQDRAGNVTDDNDVNNTQSIEVVPQVLLGGSQVRGENQVAALTVYLNGPALSYPVTVYYNFSGSADAADVGVVPMQVDITAGESATFNLPILDDGIVEGDETLTVTLVGVSGEAILGEQISHDVLVVERQVAPEVSIAVTQNGRLGHRVYTDVSEGVVSLTATTHDANNDPLTFSWASENAAIDVSACVTALCTFDPQMLNDGVYRFTLAVSDGSDQTLQSSYVQVMNGTLTVLDAADDQDGDGVDDATEGHDDADADGLADYLDVPVPPFVQQIAVGEGGVELNQALQTSAGLTIALGADAGAAAQAGVRVASNQLPRDTDYAELGGIYDFEIHGLNDGQRVATVVIPLQQPITPDAVYRMLAADLHVTREWLTFVSGSDAVSSTSRVGGVCPDANSAQWRAGLQPGASCMRLTLRDGGVNDGDREANGVIRVTAGVALAREQYSDNSAPTEGPNKGGGSVGVLWLLAACLVSLRRKRMGSGAGLSAKIERNGCTVNE